MQLEEQTQRIGMMNLAARGGMKLHAEILERRQGAGMRHAVDQRRHQRSSEVCLLWRSRCNVRFAFEGLLGLPVGNVNSQLVSARLDGKTVGHDERRELFGSGRRVLKRGVSA